MKLIVFSPTDILTIQDFPKFEKSLVFWAQDTLQVDRYDFFVNQFGIPDILVSQAHPEYPVLDSKTQYCYCPSYLYTSANSLLKYGNLPGLDSEYCFNFIINKKQVNRYLLLKMVEWFKLESYKHTWSGIGANFDMSRIIPDIAEFSGPVDKIEFQKQILAPVSNVKPYFVNTNLALDVDHADNAVSIEPYGGNIWSWNNILSDIISKSTVSLVSESISYDKVINYTEKTLYAVLGLTIPIWIGGYQQAKFWKQHGFDTFDDIINHDYQRYDTLLERCFYAFNDNLRILTDQNYSHNVRYMCKDRLQKNRNILLENSRRLYTDALRSLPPPISSFISDQTKIELKLLTP